MADWINTSISVVVLLAICGGVFKIGRWVDRIEADQDAFKDFMREIRDDIKKIISKLPPTPVTGNSLSD